jgi:hypothetical protein
MEALRVSNCLERENIRRVAGNRRTFLLGGLLGIGALWLDVTGDVTQAGRRRKRGNRVKVRSGSTNNSTSNSSNSNTGTGGGGGEGGSSCVIINGAPCPPE